MLYTKRVEFILQELQLGKSVKVADLSKTLQVSVDTIRRDLKALEQEGLIKYVRGRAFLIQCSLFPILPVGKSSTPS